MLQSWRLLACLRHVNMKILNFKKLFTKQLKLRKTKNNIY